MTSPDAKRIARQRREAVMKAMEDEGLLRSFEVAIESRIPARPLMRAKQRCRITNTRELLLYALGKVATEDDFGAQLLGRQGSIPRGSLLTWDEEPAS
jgi:hypothetical protein